MAFPLGVAYIASVLIKNGHQVNVLDLNASEHEEKDFFSGLKSLSYDVVGITAMIINLKDVLRICEKLKLINPNVPIVLGGGLPTAVPEIVLTDSRADIAVLGEGEIIVVELLKVLSKGQELDRVKGICFKQDNKIIYTLNRKEFVNLDELPFPAWHLFPMELYLHSEGGAYPQMDIISSRGCSYQCTFCFTGIFGHTFRGRSAENILQEVLMLKKKYNIKSFTIRDDTFVLNRKRVIEFCELLQAEKVDINWSCNGRVNLMDEKMLKQMRKAGCTNISYGIESGNSKIITEMKKQISLEAAKKIIRLTRKSGIVPLGYFIVGMPGETRETIKNSIDFCKQTGIIPHFNFAGPIPGTELYDYAVTHGYIKDIRKYLLETNWKYMVINMTNLDDTELIQLGNSAESEIMKYYLLRYPVLIVLLALRFMKKNGIKVFAAKLIKWFFASLCSLIAILGRFSRTQIFDNATENKKQNNKMTIVHFLDSEWELDHRRPHIEALSKYCKVVCIEPPVTIFHAIVQVNIFFKWLMRKQRKEGKEKNVFFFRPFMPVPYRMAYYSGFFGWLNNFFLKHSFKRIKKVFKGNQVVSFITCPQQICALNTLDEDAICFDCYDAYEKHPRISQKSKESLFNAEKKLLRKANIVFTTADALYREKKKLNPATYYIPNSADVNFFMQVSKTSIDLPEDLKAVPQPRIGLIGNINEIVDISLLNYLAQRNSGWSILLIGDVNGGRKFRESKDLQNLKKLSNVYFLGRKPYEQLPFYQKGIEVCLLPYLIIEYTDSVHPNKIYQYLAQKKPVVSTNLKEMNKLKEVISVSDTKEEFEGYITAILNKNAKKNSDNKLVQTAMENSTDSAARKKIKIISDYMEKNRI